MLKTVPSNHRRKDVQLTEIRAGLLRASMSRNQQHDALKSCAHSIIRLSLILLKYNAVNFLKNEKDTMTSDTFAVEISER